MQKDGALKYYTFFFALLLMLIVVSIGVLLLYEAYPAMREFGWGFLYKSDWDPVKNEYGALPFIYGTCVSAFIAIIFAVPISLGIAVFLWEIVPKRFSKPVKFLVELLAAIPSVIYGLWGVLIFIPFIRDDIQPYLVEYLGWIPFFSKPEMDSAGYGLFTAGLVLAIMIIPIIASVSIEVLKNVPDHLREAALALGATRWEMIRVSVLKTGWVGILGAILLALGRALGETMAVTMVIGANPKIQESIFGASYSISAVIANEFEEASDMLRSVLFEMGLVLFVLTLMINLFARWYVRRSMKKYSK